MGAALPARRPASPAHGPRERPPEPEAHGAHRWGADDRRGAGHRHHGDRRLGEGLDPRHLRRTVHRRLRREHPTRSASVGSAPSSPIALDQLPEVDAGDRDPGRVGAGDVGSGEGTDHLRRRSTRPPGQGLRHRHDPGSVERLTPDGVLARRRRGRPARPRRRRQLRSVRQRQRHASLDRRGHLHRRGSRRAPSWSATPCTSRAVPTSSTSRSSSPRPPA